MSTRRAAWLWLLVDPVLHTAFLMFMHTILRPHKTEGMARVVWVMLGVLSYFTFQRTANQLKHAIDANQALFSFRQVKPIDTLLVRGALEGVIALFVAVLSFVGLALIGISSIPADPLLVMEAFAACWLLGMGWGLLTSVAFELVPELDDILSVLLIPLFLFSGTIVPISEFAEPIRRVVWFNPLAHGLELARIGFTPYYRPFPDISLMYVVFFGLTTIFLGLLLHNRFEARMVNL